MRGCEESNQCRESVLLCDFRIALAGRTQVCGREVELLHQTILC